MALQTPLALKLSLREAKLLEQVVTGAKELRERCLGVPGYPDDEPDVDKREAVRRETLQEAHLLSAILSKLGA